MVAPTLRCVVAGGSRGRLTILIFHRVRAQPDPLFPNEMHASRVCRAHGMRARLVQRAAARRGGAALERGSLPARALAITFDDGYADNATVALPILRRLGLPATFFVATGFLDGGRMWNDTVIEAVRGAPGGDARPVDRSGWGGIRSNLRNSGKRRSAPSWRCSSICRRTSGSRASNRSRRKRASRCPTT